MILVIDPGINNAGMAIMDIDNKLVVKETILVKNIRRFNDDEKVVEIKYGNRTVKVIAILEEIKKILANNDITDIVIEAPFYNSLTPNAFGSLLEVITSIKYTLAIPGDYKFKLIEPLLVKKMFTNNHMASKAIIKEFLLKRKESNEIVIDKDIDTLSEHEIDAVAIGYCYSLAIKEKETESC